MALFSDHGPPWTIMGIFMLSDWLTVHGRLQGRRSKASKTAAWSLDRLCALQWAMKQWHGTTLFLCDLYVTYWLAKAL